MDKDVLSQFDHPLFPIIALIIFVLVFIIYTYWTFKAVNKKFYENSSHLPLHDGVKHER
jgi:cbb3-type cytochrome oxidase subunit 3